MRTMLLLFACSCAGARIRRIFRDTLKNDLEAIVPNETRAVILKTIRKSSVVVSFQFNQ
jgi:hypothetical protein